MYKNIRRFCAILEKWIKSIDGGTDGVLVYRYIRNILSGYVRTGAGRTAAKKWGGQDYERDQR